jgi:two-component system, NtrC family, response regulator HydG
MSKPRILVVDDDSDICLLLSRFLTKSGYEVQTTGQGRTALETLAKDRYDLVLSDHRLPDTDSLTLLERIRSVNNKIPVIIITGYSDVRVAVELMRRGAFDYVTKPLIPDEILMRIREAISAGTAPAGTDKEARPTKRSENGAVLPTAFVKGIGPSSELLQKHIELVAPTDMTVLISGETGTGKEYVARAIHALSKRAQAPFVAIDCGALPKDLAGSELFGHTKGAFTGAVADKRGSFEQADGGTLFLDEVGNLTYENQIKLLRVLQERTIRRLGSEKDQAVDVRILVATNEDLRKAVEEGRFREDLFHRLNEFAIALLPLRERKEDIPVFATHFLGLASTQLAKNVTSFSPGVMEKFTSHPWPGNLREMSNVIKRGVLLCTKNELDKDCLPAEILSGSVRIASVTTGTPAVSEGLRAASDQAERGVILAALERAGFNKSRTAEMLNIDRKTLYNKLRALNIEL